MGTVVKASPPNQSNQLWETTTDAEKREIPLTVQDRKSLVRVEKDAVLQKIKDQQRTRCNCKLCGRKKGVIESELELLYDAYYHELEIFQDRSVEAGRINMQGSMSDFGASLTAKGGILTLADDFIKNDGSKFLDLMEQLAERKLRQFDVEDSQRSRIAQTDSEDDMSEEDSGEGGSENEGQWNDGYDDEDEYIDDSQASHEMTEQERINEGRRMFQIFAAKMFEQRVLHAYHEKVAIENSNNLIAELDEEERLKTAQLEKKTKKAEAKRLLKVEKKKEEDRLKALAAQALLDEQAKKNAEIEKIAKDLEAKKMADDKSIKDALLATERAKADDELKLNKQAEDKKRKIQSDKTKKQALKLAKEKAATEERERIERIAAKALSEKNQIDLQKRMEEERKALQRLKLQREKEERARLEEEAMLARSREEKALRNKEALAKEAEMAQERVIEKKLIVKKVQTTFKIMQPAKSEVLVSPRFNHVPMHEPPVYYQQQQFSPQQLHPQHQSFQQQQHQQQFNGQPQFFATPPVYQHSDQHSQDGHSDQSHYSHPQDYQRQNIDPSIVTSRPKFAYEPSRHDVPKHTYDTSSPAFEPIRREDTGLQRALSDLKLEPLVTPVSPAISHLGPIGKPKKDPFGFTAAPFFEEKGDAIRSLWGEAEVANEESLLPPGLLSESVDILQAGKVWGSRLF